jgi:hypothetical protein
VLTQKCASKNIPLPSVESLLPSRADLEGMWESLLGHQLPVLPPVADFSTSGMPCPRSSIGSWASEWRHTGGRLRLVVGRFRLAAACYP